ncbi:hypothetical protein [Pararhodobacter oceanensis]|uniref:Uncharacterized protein n=1 Tax=Pararhodobacter oceanensis TaxID=2172121 RepID=A0A2T8HS29_9RHOB|nr:hypothetical protein [Pararhodobacter oceanensis]PVH28240.1 hypothetical protein DDE20_14160 [Pararhodobacter oceanensis]
MKMKSFKLYDAQFVVAVFSFSDGDVKVEAEVSPDGRKIFIEHAAWVETEEVAFNVVMDNLEDVLETLSVSASECLACN